MIAMLNFIKRKRVARRVDSYLNNVRSYVAEVYVPFSKKKKNPIQVKPKIKETIEQPESSSLRFSERDTDIKPVEKEAFSPAKEPELPRVRLSRKRCPIPDDLRNSGDGRENEHYDAASVTAALCNRDKPANVSNALLTIEKNLNRTFSEELIYRIDKLGEKDSTIYKAAMIDKRLFSKIVSNRDYKPSIDTAVSFAFALKLPLNEANDFIGRAGYTLSHSIKRDIIIEYCFREQIYDILEVNEVLYSLKQRPIGRY